MVLITNPIQMQELTCTDDIKHLEGCKLIDIVRNDTDEITVTILVFEDEYGKEHFLSFTDNGGWYYGNEDTKLRKFTVIK